MSLVALLAALATLTAQTPNPAPPPESRQLDPGRTRIQPKAVLSGHLLDAEGNLLVEGWTVNAVHHERPGSASGRMMSVRTGIDPATGQFRVEDLPPGVLTVSASKGSLHIDPVTVATKLGEDTSVELRYREPNPRRQLVVTIGTRPFHAFQPDPGTVHAIARDGTRHLLTPVPQRSSIEWRLADVASGTYRVEVRDPRFAEWTHSAVRTGESVSANLVGSASLLIEVVDGATGGLIEDYALVIGYRNMNIGRSAFRVRERTAPRPVGGVYTGIVPGDVTILVEGDGWPATVEVDALASGETRAVTVTVSDTFAATEPRVVSQPRAPTRSGPVVLRGRVVDTQGRPLAGVAVQVTQGEYPGHDVPGTRSGSTSGMLKGQHVTIPVRFRDDAMTTTADGWFYFGGLGPGTHALLALRGPWNDVWTKVELPRAEPVVLTLPDAALTAARLLLPEGESHEGLSLRLGRAPGEGLDIVRRARTMGGTAGLWTCGSNGSFPARYLPLGAQSFDVLRTTEEGDLSSTEVVLRHEVTITATGSPELALDLRETFPVPVTLRKPTPSLAPAGYWALNVQLTARDTQRPSDARTSRPFEAERAVETRSIAPGVYDVRVTGPGIQWSRPEPVKVVRGAANDFDIAVPLVARDVRVLGADGAPLANTSVAYWTDPDHRAADTTDADGALVVVLLEGALSVAPLPERVAPRAHPQSTRALRSARQVDPVVLNGVTARATATFAAGEGPLALRLRPE